MKGAPAGRLAGWDSLSASLHGVVERLTGLLAGFDIKSDEVQVAVLGAVMSAYLGWVCADPEHPTFVPGSGYHQHTGTPNPDTVYLTAQIDGSGTYRVSGLRGTSPEATIMPMGASGPAGIPTYPPLDLDLFVTGPDGRIDVTISATQPDPPGPWWRIETDVRTLMLRSVTQHWGVHCDPVLSIVRLDRPARRRRPPTDQVAAKLAVLPQVVEGSLAFGIRKIVELSASHVNAVRLVDYGAGGGLPGQWYHEGFYQIDGEHVLVLETRMESEASTFSLALTDAMGCTLDWVNAQASLNSAQAEVDADGILRVVVASQDPGPANWLDTMGHSTGLMQLRWSGCQAPPDISLRKVATGDLGDCLPAGTRYVTADQRAASLRDRAAGAQLRNLW